MSTGGGGGTTTTTKSDPWSGQQPYLQQGFAQAQNLYQQGGPQYYNGQTVASQSGNTQAAIDASANIGLKGNPLVNAGQNQLTSTVNGNYLNSNPYLDANFKAGSDAITTAYNNAVNGQTSGFAGGGRTGSGMQAFMQNQQNDTLAKNLNQLEGQTYYQNYNNERTNQLNATTQAPQYNQTQLDNINQLGNAGSAQDQYSQNLINANIDKYNYNQNLPASTLNQYLNQIQGNYGGSSSGTSTPTQSSSGWFGNTLGGAAAGGALGGPYGALAGGAFGALSSFSDHRLKTDVSLIGKLKNGLNLYRFRYIGGSEYHEGLMAHEVEKIKPAAVSTHPSGYKQVNYALAMEV